MLINIVVDEEHGLNCKRLKVTVVGWTTVSVQCRMQTVSNLGEPMGLI